jgi:predicted ATPase/class 3 adenylate cyclase/DNA-binding CsgD family transcriptional regulator
MADQVGQQLGNYRLIQLLGRGHWASVYLGEHLHLQTQAAIKVLHGPLANDDVESFLSEARTLARLRHPHIVRVLECGVESTMPFLVMDYAPGGSLRQQHPKGTRLPLVTVVSYVLQVAQALQYAHDQQLIHRDVKPENLLLGHDQEVLLGDFGLVIFVQSSRDTQISNSGGTIAYMAPEQIQAHPRPASDQYALAVIAYEWLAGERPFSGSSTEVAVKQTLAAPPSLCEQVPTLPILVEQVVFRALAKDPNERFASVLAFASSLEEASREDASRRTAPTLTSAYLVDLGGRTSPPGLPTGTVTLLFTDIEGSTQLLQQVGERYAEVLAACRLLLRAVFHEWHGHEVDTQGDGFFVVFARATDAVSAAVAAQCALASHSWPSGAAVRVRMGMHTGEPLLTAEGYVGLDVHHAARIMSAGHGGQVILSPTTRELVQYDLPDGVLLRDLGEHRLKDLHHQSRLFQLVIAGLPAEFAALQTLDRYPHNLPIQATPLIGREKEVAAILRLLSREEVRLVTLIGPGGIGKTRLGLQVAAELSDAFSDGVYFVNLAPISNPTFVVPTIAQTLDLKETGDQPLLDLLQASLRDKQLLLLLDNFEQVLNVASQVADLLAACPRLKVLVTSRFVLHVRGEQEFTVPPLTVPDPKHLPDLAVLSQYEAVELFIARAQAVKPEFQLTTANAPIIAEICARLDGLPLAIELAAARSKLLPPQALLARLGQRLAVLTGGAQDAPARQQTLRNTIAWSYHLLDASEQRLFRRISVFVGGCMLEAVEAVCAALDGEAAGVVDGVSSLIDKSLLQHTEQESQEPRLLMLETIREYALEASASSGEMEDTRQAYAAYYLQLAEEAEPQMVGPLQTMWLERFEREHENLRAALSWLLEQAEGERDRSSHELALRLSAALWQFWESRGYASEGRTFLERALVVSEGTVTSYRAKALKAAASMAVHQGDTERGEALCKEILTLSQQFGDRGGVAHTLYLRGIIAGWRSNLAAACSLLEEALALWRELDDKNGITWALYFLSLQVREQGEYAKARALCEECLTLHREMGNTGGIAYALYQLALILLMTQSDQGAVRGLLEESLALARELGDRRNMIMCFSLLGEVSLQQGDMITARSFIEQSLGLSKEIGDLGLTADALTHLGIVNFVQGDYTAARALYEESMAFPFGVHPWSLEELASVVVAQGEPTWAAQLWGAAEALRESLGTPMPPVMRADYERSVAAARAQLGEQAFAAAWAEGRKMTLEQALAAKGPVAMLTAAPAEPSSVPHAPKAPTNPDGLTTREVEVLHLVAQGLTNAQIATELVVSPHTVHAHVRSIHSKLGLSSRSAVTRYAFEHHLA